MKIDVGGERNLVAGLREHYKADELVGKKIILVSNLKPAKLRGVLSEGMILAASDQEGKLVLATTDQDIDSGSEVR